jgi:hypothetical protein
VLEVKDDPVETGPAAEFRGQRGREVGKDADECLAGMDARSKVSHTEMMARPW